MHHEAHAGAACGLDDGDTLVPVGRERLLADDRDAARSGEAHCLEVRLGRCDDVDEVVSENIDEPRAHVRLERPYGLLTAGEAGPPFGIGS